MDVTAEVDIAATPEQVHPWVDDLSRYVEWLTILTRADAVAGDDHVWDVELQAKVGPLARSKALRMRRTIDQPLQVRFERDEVDGRSHSPWILGIELEPIPSGTRLRMGLHYGGSFGGGIVERLLADEIDRSRDRLRSMVESGSATP